MAGFYFYLFSRLGEQHASKLKLASCFCSGYWKPFHGCIPGEHIKLTLLCSLPDRGALMQSKMDALSAFSIRGSPFSDPDEDCENLSHKHDRARHRALNGAPNLIQIWSCWEHKICHKRLVSTEFIKVKDDSPVSGRNWAFPWRPDLQLQESPVFFGFFP